MAIARRARKHSESELLDQLVDIVIEFETDGRIAHVNRAVERVFGRSPESLVGSSFLELLAPADREETLAQFRKVVETGSEATIRCAIPRDDGLRVAVESTLRRFERASGELAIAAVCREVTQPASEAALDKLRSARFRALFESGPSPTAIAAADGSIVSANRAFKSALSGVSHVEDLVSAVHRTQRSALATAWYESTRPTGAEAGGLDVSFVDANGERTWVALSWNGFSSDDDERLYAIQAKDITRHKQLELALALLVAGIDGADPSVLQPFAASLARALELDRIALARVDDGADDECEALVVWQDGDFLAAGAISLTDLPESTVAAGKTCIHPTGLTRLLPAVIDRVGRDFESFAGQPLLAEDGCVIGLIAGYSRRSIQDPDRVRDLLALAARPLAKALDTRATRRPTPVIAERPSTAVGRELLYRVIQQSADLVFVCDLDTTVLFANDIATHRLGSTGNAPLAGRPLLGLLAPSDASRLRSEVLPRLTPGFPWCGELALDLDHDHEDSRIETDATVFLFSESLEPTTLRGGPDRTAGRQRSYLAVTLHDISARRRTEEALRVSEARLVQARKMESVGRLAGGIAHDFNNLLTAIIGYSDLVLQELDPEHASRRDIEEILRAAERAGGLTRQLLAFSRRQVLQPERVDLNSVVADIDRMLRRLIGEDIELVTELRGELAPIVADPGQIEQVIVNLVVNARDAMPRGGRIGLETSNFDCSVPVRVESGMLAPGRYVALRVSDTGVGMDDETRAQIFEPFFTTKEAAGGTGLGLASAYGIISQSRGQIDVTSRVGEGSTFTIYLPAARETEPESTPTDVAPASRGRETVLLVEDSGPVRRLVERMLSRKGYTVLVAESATAALRHCSRHDGAIDLLLTDVVLPRMAGPEVARRARQIRPGLRVLYMSGFTDETLTQHGLSSLEPDLLSKPFSSATVLARVRQRLDDPATAPEEPTFLVEQPHENQ